MMQGKFGARIVLKLAMNGKTIFWTVTIKKNPNFQILKNEFGRDETEWVGKTILLKLEQDEFTDSYYSRVTFPVRKK